MKQVARNVTMVDWGLLAGMRYLLHDRDKKFCAAFRSLLRDTGVEPIALRPKSPNLNAFAERWVRSVKEEVLDRLIFFGRASLQRALDRCVRHFHEERNHQGRGNVIPFPVPGDRVESRDGDVVRRDSLGGLLSCYHREAG